MHDNANTIDSGLPDFDALPAVDGMPQGCAWGVFDHDGAKDVLGTLNLLTPDVVKAAAAEIKDGLSFSLNWPLDAMKFTFPGRDAPVHRVRRLDEHGIAAWDDTLEFNTQTSSQWDSLCHFLHQPSALAYNGAVCSYDALQAPVSTLPTLDSWHARGALVARGVLLDYPAYASAHGIAYSPFDGTPFSVRDLEAVAAHQGVQFRVGDVLVVRTGYTEALSGRTAEEQLALLSARTCSGVEPSQDVARWVWNKHFAAVASDSFAFEAIPLTNADGAPWKFKDMVLHWWFLSMFGLPIGELWDLTALSAHCKASGRYTFFLTSVPLNIPNLIGSPPNALAIF